MNTAPATGTIVTFVPRGRTRRVTVKVQHAEDIDGWLFISGYLPSKTYPGDYRGYGGYFVTDGTLTTTTTTTERHTA